MLKLRENICEIISKRYFSANLRKSIQFRWAFNVFSCSSGAKRRRNPSWGLWNSKPKRKPGGGLHVWGGGLLTWVIRSGFSFKDEVYCNRAPFSLFKVWNRKPGVIPPVFVPNVFFCVIYCYIPLGNQATVDFFGLLTHVWRLIVPLIALVSKHTFSPSSRVPKSGSWLPVLRGACS